MEEFVELNHLIWEIAALQKHCIGKLLADQNIHFGQPPLLCTIKRLGFCNQQELAHILNVSPASITVSLQRMEKAGLLQRLPDPNDLRSNRIQLTKRGEQAADWAQKVLQQVNEHRFAGFSEEEYAQMLQFYRRIQKNLTDYKNRLEEST